MIGWADIDVDGGDATPAIVAPEPAKSSRKDGSYKTVNEINLLPIGTRRYVDIVP